MLPAQISSTVTGRVTVRFTLLETFSGFHFTILVSYPNISAIW